MRHITGIDLHQRFPGISAFLAKYDLDLHRDLIPVRPAAHYLMGGIQTDLDGRTNIQGLFAAGEAACTGVHGANRLASNSLLEGLVFGARAASAMLAAELEAVAVPQPSFRALPLSAAEEMEVEGIITHLQRGMWACAGLLREAATLRRGLELQKECLATLEPYLQEGKNSRRLHEALSLCRVARAILLSSLARTESRGAHFRNDFPQRDDLQFSKHSALGSDGLVRFLPW
jgi:L-aspartate oxidase